MVDIRSDSPGKDHVNPLVRGNGKAHEEGGCASAFQQDMELTGAWPANTTILVRDGSQACTVAVLRRSQTSGTDFLSNAWFSVRGETTHDEPEWVVQTPELSSTWTMRKWECNSISKDVAKKAGQWWTSVLVGSTP